MSNTNTWTGSPSKLSKLTPGRDNATVPIRRSTLLCLVWGIATPRPIPVEPSSSRLSTARTISSDSAAFNWLVLARLPTISRMTPSLVVAVSSGMMASRTTKSVMRMPDLPSLFACFLQRGHAGHLASRGRAPSVLHLFLIAAQLGFQFIYRQIHCCQDIVVALAGDKIVFVFRRDQDLDQFDVVFQIHRDFDRHDPFEEVQQLFCFFSDELLCRLTEMPMPCRDFDLHRVNSFIAGSIFSVAAQNPPDLEWIARWPQLPSRSEHTPRQRGPLIERIDAIVTCARTLFNIWQIRARNDNSAGQRNETAPPWLDRGGQRTKMAC